ncbi:MAG: TetR/AcrR family transcriptional regulator [Ferrovibrio sp.]|uniref:TetR/AcrR family transcriptional regulator n=1 Tax=Ferrovibrio sp. TaxID=1917215 RepID=UPI00260DB782|nr:TetR/AcrR family transcriptional regulator [Ferrovibrio sp.]MCW0232037.1 TetR/AcrR family transcriptional regulator [Ferrovibrio sp.]
MPADLLEKKRTGRREAVRAFKREAILQAARKIFARDGLDGATLRAIAAEAGIAVGTVYLHYPAKESLYAELLAGSLADLQKHLRDAVTRAMPDDQLMAGALAFYDFYRQRPDDLYLGLYLGQGLRPAGLTPELDRLLNGRLIQCYTVLSDAMRRQVPSEAPPLDADMLRAETVSLAAATGGALMLEVTGRLKVLGDTGKAVVRRHVELLVQRLRAAS